MGNIIFVKKKNMQLNALFSKTCTFLIVLFTLTTNVYGQWLNGQAADLVFGQPNFTNRTGGGGLNGFLYPFGVAVERNTNKVYIASYGKISRYANYEAYTNGDPAEMQLTKINTDIPLTRQVAGIFIEDNNLWVCELDGNRVLRIPNPSTMSDGATANLVLGQSDFTNTSGGQTLSKFSQPISVFVKDNTLWVSQLEGNKVFRFDNVSSKTNGANADAYLGNLNGVAGTTASTFNKPGQIYVDAANNLWVADRDNSRVLKFEDAKSFSNGAPASLVLGQPDFFTATRPNSNTNTSLSGAYAVYGDTFGNLYVGQVYGNRVSVYKDAANINAHNGEADFVIGQVDFTAQSTAVNEYTTGGISALFVDKYLWVSELIYNRVLRFNPLYPLPVSLVSYSVEATTNGRIGVRWRTASEADNKHFELLASTDGKIFHKVAEVKTKAANGNSQAVLDYHIDLDVENLLGGAALASFGLLGFLLLPAFRRKTSRILVTCIAILAFVACKKEQNEKVTEVYVKLIQVDIDGKTEELGVKSVKVKYKP